MQIKLLNNCNKGRMRKNKKKMNKKEVDFPH